MIGLLVGLLLLSWLFGRSRGLLGGLVGGFLGALVLAGMAGTANSGELATLYTPAKLAAKAVPVAAVAAGLALVAPYATGFATLGWGAGALLAMLAAPRTGQTVYVLPLTAHLLAALAVGRIASWRATTSDGNSPGDPSRSLQNRRHRARRRLAA